MTENRKNYFFWNQEAFREAVKAFVCPQCEYFNPGGACLNPDPRGCALLRYLPQLVVDAQRLKNPADIEEYVRKIRGNIRMECAAPGGHCTFHDTLACSLSTHLPALLKAIAEADRNLEKRIGFEEYGTCGRGANHAA